MLQLQDFNVLVRREPKKVWQAILALPEDRSEWAEIMQGTAYWLVEGAQIADFANRLAAGEQVDIEGGWTRSFRVVRASFMLELK